MNSEDPDEEEVVPQEQIFPLKLTQIEKCREKIEIVELLSLNVYPFPIVLDVSVLMIRN